MEEFVLKNSQVLSNQHLANALDNAKPIWELLQITEKEYYLKYHTKEEEKE